MKLNKFLVAAAAVAVLPLSVANAEGPETNNVPEFKGGVNGAEPAIHNIGPYAEKGPSAVAEPVAVGLDGEPVKGVNGPGGAVNDVKPYGASVVKPLVNEKPAYNPSKGTVRVDKGTEAPKADQAKRVLPKTSAVK